MAKLKILFLCTGNSCRSQMAEGWAHHLKSETFDAYSAGVEPHGMNQRAIHVMQEAGVDISSQSSKHVDTLMNVPFDYVVTVCGHANETCPAFPGKARIVHVGFDDPPLLAKSAATEEEALEHYRRVRDEIRDWVMTLPESLERAKQPAPRDRTKPGILVLCTANAARSQMAEGFLKSLAGNRFDIHSAGMNPAEEIHPLAVRVMREAGIDITGQWPKSSRVYLGRAWFKYVLIVCQEAEISCPRFFIGATKTLTWPTPDPAAIVGSEEQQLAAFRGIRDQIAAHIRTWLANLKD